MKKKYLIRAIDYVNGKPHIGHALEYVNIDVLARYFRYAGFDVRMGVGTDEHGQKIQQAAEAVGITTQEYCDGNAAVFRDLAETLNVSFDTFVRTSDPEHKKQCQTFWQEMLEAGDIYE
jgi:methionyl-tRNA synthetase